MEQVGWSASCVWTEAKKVQRGYASERGTRHLVRRPTGPRQTGLAGTETGSAPPRAGGASPRAFGWGTGGVVRARALQRLLGRARGIFARCLRATR